MKFLFVFLLSLLSMSALAQHKKAFLLGIGDYPEHLGWKKLHGNEDAKAIEKLLIEKGAFDKNQIVLITEQDATHENVLQQLDTFITRLQPNDTVVFYFSGHGQRVSDLDGDERNEDNLDEAFIMYNTPLEEADTNASYRLQNHLLDDALGVRYDSIRSKIGANGFLFVMIDACFSGFSLKGTDFELVDKGTYKSYIIDDIQPTTTDIDSTALSELIQVNNTYAPVLMLTASTNTVAKEIKEYNSGALTLSFIDLVRNSSFLSNNQLSEKIRNAYDRYLISTDIHPWVYGANDDGFFLVNQAELFPKNANTFFTYTFPSSFKKNITKLFPYGVLHGLTEGTLLQVVNRQTGKIEAYAKVIKASLLNSYIVFDNESNIVTDYDLQSKCAFIPYLIAPINAIKISIDKKQLKDFSNQFSSESTFLSSILTTDNADINLSFDKKSKTFSLTSKKVMFYQGTDFSALYNKIVQASFDSYLYQNKTKQEDLPLEIYQSINGNQYCTRNNISQSKDYIYPIIFNYDNQQFSQIVPNNYTSGQDMLAKGYNEYSNAYDLNLPKQQIVVITQEFEGEYNKKRALLLTPIAPLYLEKSAFNKNVQKQQFWNAIPTNTFPTIDINQLKSLDDKKTKIAIYNLSYDGDECITFPPNESCKSMSQ